MEHKWIQTRLFLLLMFHTVVGAQESVFALEGNSVTLVMKHHYMSPDQVIWKFNQSHDDIVRYYPRYDTSRQLRISNSYKGRVAFDNTTFSLGLKNLMKNDSGLYTAEVVSENNSAVQYCLRVFERVSAPVLTVDHPWPCGDICDVTCKAGDLSLTSPCNNGTCTRRNKTAISSLVIFIRDGAIICNHSNPVSWSTAALHHTQEFTVGKQTSIHIYITVVLAGGLGLLLVGVILYLQMHLKNQAGSLSSNIYQSLGSVFPAEMLAEKNQTEVACTKKALTPMTDKSPSTIYCELQPQSGPRGLETPQLENVSSSEI